MNLGCPSPKLYSTQLSVMHQDLEKKVFLNSVYHTMCRF